MIATIDINTTLHAIARMGTMTAMTAAHTSVHVITAKHPKSAHGASDGSARDTKTQNLVHDKGPKTSAVDQSQAMTWNV